MTKIEGLTELSKQLSTLTRKVEPRVSVQVGFTQSYGLIVHEDLKAHHPVGQAKFLETPARSMRSELTNIVKKAYKKTGSMSKALLLAGLRLQREAQKLTPVDTSALRASAYTALERDADNAALEAFSRSEKIRLRKKGK